MTTTPLHPTAYRQPQLTTRIRQV
ncbi:hypothetical protein RSAG8_01062, partial [Rhizoctonia solani AG-8 WAC10335]